VQLRTQFAALEGSHPDADPVPNTHIVTMDWTRVELDLKLPLSKVTEMELQIPYDTKDMVARYELPDGTEFDNPQGDLHHRTEKLEGFADFRLYWHFRFGDLRLSAGINLPVGDTVEDPFTLGDLGLNHQHVQFGTGTCDPLARIGYIARLSESFDVRFSGGAHVPLVENSHGFQAPPMFDFAAGPRFAVTDWLSFQASYSILYQGRGYWDGVADPNTGYTMQGVQASMPMAAWGAFLVPHVYRAIDVTVRDEGDTFKLDWIVGVSLEFVLGGTEPLDEYIR
jgi:hypothetical protein